MVSSFNTKTYKSQTNFNITNEFLIVFYTSKIIFTLSFYGNIFL